jgi:5-methyltetrahydrofolate--homocysteine methyltransferase
MRDARLRAPHGLGETMNELSEAIQRGDAASAKSMTEQLVAAGRTAADILNGALLPGMAILGTRFRDREIFLPDVLLAARAMKAAIKIIEPLLVRDAVPSAGVVVLGTVRGDLHDIGKNLVAVMLQGAGYHVVDLGNDVDAERFVETAIAENAAVIGMSALLTTTMTEMAEVVAKIGDRGLRGRVRTIIGGAPVNAAFAREIGADAYAPDAVSAVDRIAALVGR